MDIVIWEKSIEVGFTDVDEWDIIKTEVTNAYNVVITKDNKTVGFAPYNVGKTIISISYPSSSKGNRKKD